MNRDRKGSYTGNGSKVSEFLIRKNHHQVVQARQCPAEQVHSQDIFYFHIEYAEFHVDFIDDEKPLYISTDSALDITGFHDEATPECRYISGGIYCLTPAAVKTLHGCMEKGMSRMRNFQRQLVADGLKLKAYPFTKILDVDHAGDIVKAENFLAGKEE